MRVPNGQVPSKWVVLDVCEWSYAWTIKIGRLHLKAESYRVHDQQREDCVLVGLGPFIVRLWRHCKSFSERSEGREPNRTLLPQECSLITKPSWYLITALPSEYIVISGSVRIYVYCGDRSV